MKQRQILNNILLFTIILIANCTQRDELPVLKISY